MSKFLYPSMNDSHDLGNVSRRWSEVFTLMTLRGPVRYRYLWELESVVSHTKKSTRIDYPRWVMLHEYLQPGTYRSNFY